MINIKKMTRMQKPLAARESIAKASLVKVEFSDPLK